MSTPAYDESFFKRIKSARNETNGIFDCTKLILGIVCASVVLHIFKFILMVIPISMIVIGCVFIYRAKEYVQFTDKNAPNFCHEILYMFAFWITNSSFVIVGVLICFAGCIGCIAVCGRGE
uniref:Uncharacterized protein n=1 Tax=Biomphalaria glabrata TaxID=6526 RepID=A0A2C9L0C1_BIOGL